MTFRQNQPIERQLAICSRVEKDDFFAEDSLEVVDESIAGLGTPRFHTHPTILDDEGDWLAGTSGSFARAASSRLTDSDCSGVGCSLGPNSSTTLA